MSKRRALTGRTLAVASLALLIACVSGEEPGYENAEQPVVVVESSVCRVEYTVTGQWGTGFGANVRVTNKSGGPLQNWALSWDFPSGQRITSLWNGTYTQSGSRVEVKNPSWGTTLQPNSPADIGFNGTHNGTNNAPTGFTLNGATCS